MAGIIYVKVALYLEADVEKEEAQEIVEAMDYNFKHTMISHTEIKDLEVS
jgi:hypothetical protein